MLMIWGDRLTYVNHVPPLLSVTREKWGTMSDAGVVDADVKPTVVPTNDLKHRQDVLFFSDVTPNSMKFPLFSLQFFGQILFHTSIIKNNIM